MSTPIFGRLYDSDIIQAIRNVQEETSTIKKAIFKSALLKNDIDKKFVDHYLNNMNTVIKYWDDYSANLMNKIKAASGSENVYSIRYEWVKDFIYASFDYASVLQFVDGIIQICTKPNVKISDIEGFREHTISKAFKNLPLSIAELSDSVLSSQARKGLNMYCKTDKMEAKLFDSIRSYKIFNGTDRKELYKSIDYVMAFISMKSNIIKYFSNLEPELFIAAINNIFDYIVYSISAFACRTYIISCYAYPYIDNSGNRPVVMGESVKTKELNIGSTNSLATEITTLKELDNAKYNNPDNGKELFGKLYGFLKEVGCTLDKDCDEIVKYYSTEYYNSIPHRESNVFIKPIAANPIIKFYSTISFRMYSYDKSAYMRLIEINQIVKELFYNSNQGIAGTNSPKQEMFHTIRAVNPKNQSDCKSAAVDLYMFAVSMCGCTACLIRELRMFREAEHNEPKFNTTALNISAETIKILLEFYTDLVTIIIAKGRDFEARFNSFRSTDVTSIDDKLKAVTTIAGPEDILMTAIPSTTRLPIDMIDIYSKPTYESFELYDEYAKYLLEASDDLYFTEAFNISNIINTISSLIVGAWKRLVGFFNDRTVKKAIDWVTKHQQELNQMDFSGAEMYVLPYKIDINIHPRFRNLANGIKGFNEKDIENNEAVDKFIKGLYPDETIYGWFNNDDPNGSKIGSAKYRNYMLFYDESSTSENIPEKVLIKDAIISRNVKEWVKTMMTVKETVDAYKRLGDDISSGINSMKTKLVSISNNGAGKTVANVAQIGGNDKNNTPPSLTENNNDKKADMQVDQHSQQDKNAAVGNNINIVLNKTNVVVTNIYVSLNSIFIDYIKAMYSYLQEAYTKGNK